MSNHVISLKAIKPEREIENALPQLLHQVFEAVADKRSDHPALEHADTVLSYAELERRANQMAQYLKSKGIGPGQFVPLFMKKSPELFVALLGVLKAGAAYVPIDPKFPLDRVGSIIEDTDAKLILTHTPLFDSIEKTSPGLALNVDALAQDIAANPETRLSAEETGVTPSDVCYVIFTSGSTGRPKGVMVEHHNVCAFASCLGPVYGITADDRMYQGFSIAFDAAVEEVWGAWANGGTLIVGEEDVSRSPLDVAQFLTSKRISVFSTVPSFLAMIDQELPAVKLLIVGGEACPGELVTRWAGCGRRMLNTYGPTEATVVATVTDLKPGVPVSIGKPLPGYYAYVLDENMQPVNPGEAGELYIGGVGVARGYINRDDLNTERFIADPFLPAETKARLYRSFDHVRLQKDGNIGFIGRLDGQVKIRGFRVELPEIEAVLLSHSDIRAAAVTMTEHNGEKYLAAYVVLVNAEETLERQEIVTLLQNRLPDYMMPRYLDVIDALPLMTSGKVDRKSLPPAKTLLKTSSREVIPPQTDMEKTLADLWSAAIGVDEVSIDDDFFLDLGGHSLLAAQVVTSTRKALNSDNISVRDLYQHRTIREFAEYVATIQNRVKLGPDSSDENKTPTAEERFNAQCPWTRRAVVAAQALGVYVFYAILSAPVLAAIFLIRMTFAGNVSVEDAAFYATVGSFAVWPSMLIFSIALKWIVIGRYKPGKYPLWGWYYFRWWLVNRFMALSWSNMFVGTPLMSLYFRAMGARVGKNAVINTNLCSAFDLVTIGDNTSIGSETQLLGYRVEDGMLILGSIDIGDECFIGMHSTLGLNTIMRDRSKLDDMSALADDDRMHVEEERRGCPSAPVKLDMPRPKGINERKPRPLLFGLLHLALIYVMGYFLILTMLPSAVLIGAALYYGGYAWGIGAAFLTVPLGVVWYMAATIAVKWVFVGRVKPGTHSVWSLTYLRHWFLDYLLNNARIILMPFYATTYFPTFLRLMGAKIGRNVEISTVLHVTPDLLEIGEGSFCADASLIGGKRVHNGLVEVKSNRIGARSFIGNSALLPGGVDIGDDCLVGVMSTPPTAIEEREDNLSWFGSPGFILPRPNNTVSFETDTTFSPSRKLQRIRAAIDIVRILLPGVLAMAGAVAYVTTFILMLNYLPFFAALLLAPIAAIALSFAAMGMAAGVKWLLIGRFEPDMKPLYSVFIWLNEIVNAVFESVAAVNMPILLGTPFLAEPMRWMGCKIGRWVYLDTTLFSEFDLVDIGDYSALNLGTTIQTHLFEDRIMKTAELKIGRGCTVANMSAVLYGTEMKNGSWLGPLSVLMKGDILPAMTRWHGIPSQLALLPRSKCWLVIPIAQTLKPLRNAALSPAQQQNQVTGKMAASAPVEINWTNTARGNRAARKAMIEPVISQSRDIA